MDSAAVRVLRHQADVVRQRLFDADGRLGDVRHPQVRIDLNAARGQRYGGSPAERVGEAGVANVQVALPLAVDAKRLLVSLRRKPVVEDPAAAADRRITLFERRPREPGARHDVVPVVQIGLQFVTSAEAERETFVNSPVVLRVPPELDLIEIDSARARSPLESRGASRAKSLEAGEVESAVLIAEIGRVVTRRFDLKAGSHAVFFERNVEIVGEFKLARAA